MGSYERLANRALHTDLPIMVELAELSKSAKDVMPLGQGAVYWQPPEQAFENVKQIAQDVSTSRYGAHEGLPELREALLKKLKGENKLLKSSVMVTAGSNQGFLTLVLVLCDVSDSVVLFSPYFFNAYMTFKMTGINNILIGPTDLSTLLPDADWLEKTLSETKPVPKLVSIVNPGNPSGVCFPKSLLEDTYEKIAYSPEAEGLRTQLLKVQDNSSICTAMISQKVALGCLKVGPEWVRHQVEILSRNRLVLREALSQPLGEDAVKGGQGAIYLWIKLPENYPDDGEVVRWFARKHGVLLLPGSSCGAKGCVRITYGMLKEEECQVAAKRLKSGMEELVRYGMID